MTQQRIFLKRNEIDTDMIEMYTNIGTHTCLACVFHEDCLDEIVSNYGDGDNYLTDGVVAYITLAETEKWKHS